MKDGLLAMVIVLCSLSLLTPMSMAELGPPERGPSIAPLFSWPMLGGGYDRQGLGESTGPVNSSQLWSTDIPNDITSYSQGVAIADGLVFIGLGPQMSAYDAYNGSSVWNFTVPKGIVTAHPLACRGMVLFGAQFGNGTFYALDETTGSVVWTQTVGNISGICPVADEDLLYVPTDSNGLFALNLSDGSVAWSMPLPNYRESSPAYHDGILYCGIDGGIYALNLSRREIDWKSYTSGYRSSSVVFSGGFLLVHSGRALDCFNASSGKRIWTVNLEEYYYYLADFYATPSVSGGRVFLGTSGTGKFFCFELDNGSLLWTQSLSSDVVTAPAVSSNGILYVVSENNLEAMDSTNGRKIWDFPTWDSLFSPALAYGCLYLHDGNALRAFGRIAADNEPPSLSITSPTEGSFTSSPAILLKGLATDDRGIYSMESSVDGGAWAPLDGNSAWSGNLSISPGWNTIYVRATDLSGKTSISSLNLTLDAEPPQVSITAPANGTMFSHATVTVAGTASDNDQLSAVEVSLNGNPWQHVGLNSTWNYTFTLPDGDAAITARAWDLAGNTCETGVAFTVDTQGPNMTILSPKQRARLPNLPATVSGSANDSAGVRKVELSPDGINWTACNGTESWTGSLVLHPGDNEIYIRATDSVGNYRIESLELHAASAEGGRGGQWAFPLLPVLILAAGAMIAAALVLRGRRKYPRRSAAPVAPGIPAREPVPGPVARSGEVRTAAAPPPPAAPPQSSPAAGDVATNGSGAVAPPPPPAAPAQPSPSIGNVAAVGSGAVAPLPPPAAPAQPSPAAGTVAPATTPAKPSVLSNEERERLEKEVEDELALAGNGPKED